MEADQTRMPRMGKVFIAAFLLIVIVAFLFMIKNFLIALLLAGISAALLMNLQRWMSTKMRGRPRTAAVIILLLVLLIIGIPLIGLAALVAGEAVKVGTMVAPWVSEQLSSGSTFMDLLNHLPFGEQLEPYRDTIVQRLKEIGASLGNFIISSIPNLTRGTAALLLNIFIFTYALYYFLVSGESLMDTLVTYIPLHKKDSELIFERGITVIKASVKGILVIGLIQGLMIAAAFWIMGIPGAAFWGAVVLVLSAIPGVGAPLVWIPAVIYLVTAGRIGWAIVLTIWGMLVVGLVDNILRPAVVGRDAKLPDLLILVSILGGLVLFGAAGILIGPVIAALLATALDIYKTMFSSELHETSDNSPLQEEDA
jgi:predicted PurR-regulated permease PerM